MTTPAHPEGVPDAPVNIAPPNWQCPHCRTEYHRDLDAATACAQAGPPPPVTPGAPALILTGHGAGQRVDAPVFGLTEVGPVKPETIEGKRQHRTDVLVAGVRVHPARLAGTAPAHDGLLVVSDTRRDAPDQTLRSPNLSSFGTLTELFLGKRSGYGYHSGDLGVITWVDEPSHHGCDDRVWWRAPEPPERAALNVITAGLLDKIVEADEDDLTARIRYRYAPGERRHSFSQEPADLAGPDGGLMLAHAHGAPNHIWALRWLTAHLDQVVTWQARTLRAWAAGDLQGLGPLPASFTLRIPESLPKNPGKRRLDVMAPYGEAYLEVRNTLNDRLTTGEPTNPVPGLGDVETTIRERD